MSQNKVRPQISRWKELLNPTTNNFEVWVAILSLSLFTVSSAFQFLVGWWNMIGLPYIPLSTPLFYPTPLQIFIAIIGAVFLLITIAALIGLAVTTIRSFLSVKFFGGIPETDDIGEINQRIRNHLKQLKKRRGI